MGEGANGSSSMLAAEVGRKKNPGHLGERGSNKLTGKARVRGEKKRVTKGQGRTTEKKAGDLGNRGKQIGKKSPEKGLFIPKTRVWWVKKEGKREGRRAKKGERTRNGKRRDRRENPNVGAGRTQAETRLADSG